MGKLAFVLLAGAIGLVGCQRESPAGGAPGAGSSSTFTVKVPSGETDIKQGQTDEVEITVDRGSAFNQEVRVTLELPPGLTAEPATFTLGPNEKSRKVTLKAAPDAPPGPKMVKVNAAPPSGQATSEQFRVKIDPA